MSVLLLYVSALSAPQAVPVVRTVRVPGTSYVTGCPGLPPTIAAEKGKRQKKRNLTDLPRGQVFSAMLVGSANCWTTLTYPAPARRRAR